MSSQPNYEYKVVQIDEIKVWSNSDAMFHKTSPPPPVVSQVQAIFENPELQGYEYYDSVTLPIVVYGKGTIKLERKGQVNETFLLFRRPV